MMTLRTYVIAMLSTFQQGVTQMPTRSNIPNASAVLAIFGASARGEDESKWTQRRTRYEELMTSLGQQSAPAAEDTRTEAEVVRIAKDRAARPETYAEFEKVYVKTFNRLAHVPHARSAKAEHLSEQYRYVWEYLYLRPGEPDDAPGYAGQASEALATIGNPASVGLVMDRYRRLGKGDASIQGQIQEGMIADLGRYFNETALEALLECASAPGAQGRSDVPASFRVDVTEKVRKALQPRSADSANKWALVIQKFQANPAKRDKAALLKTLISGTGSVASP